MAKAPSVRKRPCCSSPISRILSQGRRGGALRTSWVTIYLGRPLPDGSCGQPGDSGEQPSNVSCSALHRVGLAWPPCHHGAGALLPHHFTIAAGRGRRAVYFCCAFPRVSPAGRYPAPCSTVSGLSSKIRQRRIPAATQAAGAVYIRGQQGAGGSGGAMLNGSSWEPAWDLPTPSGMGFVAAK
jgi:hypothetical protein